MDNQNITSVSSLNGKSVSDLLSEHTANNAKVSADGSIDTHSDVTITGTPSDNQLLIYSTGQWRNVASPFLRLDGTVSMTGGLNMNSQNITNVGQLNGRVVSTLFTEHDANKAKVSADGSIDTHSDVTIATAAENQFLIYTTGQWRNTNSPFLRLDGTVNMTGGLNMNSQNITNVGQLNGRVVSTLFSEHDANKAKVSADGSIDTHSDVVITGPVVNGQLLTYNGTNWVNATGSLTYLSLTGGTMSGDINMGNKSITNVNLVDGVDVSVLNSSAVKTSGNQTIAGIKTYSSGVEITGNSINATTKGTFIVFNSTSNIGAIASLDMNTNTYYNFEISAKKISLLLMGRLFRGLMLRA